MHTKTVLITGASRGIGAALARRFAAAGYNLVLNCAHSKDTLEALAADLKNTCAVNCICCLGDIGDFSFVKEMIQTASDTFGGIDVLINNAGIASIGLLTDMDIEDWNRILSTNLTSVFSTCRCAVPCMVHNKQGKIINISSVSGILGNVGQANYAASKAGVIGLTKTMARELGSRGITVNAIAPGFVDTEMTEVLSEKVNAIACGWIDTDMNACFSPEERRELEDEIPAGRYGTPEEVAELAFSLAAGHSYLTGQVITLDGGWI